MHNQTNFQARVEAGLSQNDNVHSNSWSVSKFWLACQVPHHRQRSLKTIFHVLTILDLSILDNRRHIAAAAHQTLQVTTLPTTSNYRSLAGNTRLDVGLPT